MVLEASRTYGRAHKNTRETWRPRVDTGQANCAELDCLEDDRWIEPGTPWDLAHDRDAGPGHYLGPAHARCNRSEGARWQWVLRQLEDTPHDDHQPRPNRWVL